MESEVLTAGATTGSLWLAMSWDDQMIEDGEVRHGPCWRSHIQSLRKLGGPHCPHNTRECSAGRWQVRHRAGTQSDKGRVSLQSCCGKPLWPPSIPEALASCQPPLLHCCTNKFLLADRLNHLGMASGNIAPSAWHRWTRPHSQLVPGYRT